MDDSTRTQVTIVSAESGINLKPGDLLKYHAQIRSELPGLLTQITQKGAKDEALRLLTGWGTREIKNSQIWKEAKAILKQLDERPVS